MPNARQIDGHPYPGKARRCDSIWVTPEQPALYRDFRLRNLTR